MSDGDYVLIRRWRRGHPADPAYETMTVGTSGDDRWYIARTGPVGGGVGMFDDEASAIAQAREWMTAAGWIEDP
jgi:hypothetical protein